MKNKTLFIIYSAVSGDILSTGITDNADICKSVLDDIDSSEDYKIKDNGEDEWYKAVKIKGVYLEYISVGETYDY